MDRISEELITVLKENEVFVFGSNLSGIHGAGAARQAYEKFGAVWGQGVGALGDSYAIPTKDRWIVTMLLEDIAVFVKQFEDYALKTPQKKFLVTQIGCGLAGFTPEKIAPLFHNCLTLENVYLPQCFVDVLTKERG